jgi:hypothetical protein
MNSADHDYATVVYYAVRACLGKYLLTPEHRESLAFDEHHIGERPPSTWCCFIACGLIHRLTKGYGYELWPHMIDTPSTGKHAVLWQQTTGYILDPTFDQYPYMVPVHAEKTHLLGLENSNGHAIDLLHEKVAALMGWELPVNKQVNLTGPFCWRGR